jgi:hypothetical protein
MSKLHLKPGEFVGVVYDIFHETTIDVSPTIRATRQEALADAIALCAHINANPDEYNGFEADTEVDTYVKSADGVEFWSPTLVDAGGTA